MNTIFIHSAKFNSLGCFALSLVKFFCLVNINQFEVLTFNGYYLNRELCYKHSSGIDIGDVRSKPKFVERGVHQGCVLGLCSLINCLLIKILLVHITRRYFSPALFPSKIRTVPETKKWELTKTVAEW